METGVEDIKKLAAEGWSVWPWEPAAEVYDRQVCKNNKSAFWLRRDGFFMCVGCGRQCCLYRPKGFRKPKNSAHSNLYELSPDEMVTKKKTLTVAEAAYCLDISVSRTYRLLATGVLVARPFKPIRIKSESVRDAMETFDE